MAEVSQAIITKGVNQTLELILNKEKYNQTVFENYSIGKQNLSLSTLEVLLRSIINSEK
jgi:hypothetical protein